MYVNFINSSPNKTLEKTRQPHQPSRYPWSGRI